MTEQPPTTTAEAERIALLRDPPEPPGYVDPLEGSPTLDGSRTADSSVDSGKPTPGVSKRGLP